MKAHQFPIVPGSHQTSNINDLSGSSPIERLRLWSGNWLIRADGNTGGPTPTGTPSPTPTATCAAGYTTATSTGTITPGGTDIGNHCDDCNTDIVLPFPVNVYGAPVSVATVGSNGDLQLTASPSEKLFFVLDQCVPVRSGSCVPRSVSEYLVPLLCRSGYR